MVFNATINNISVISWWSVLLVEDPEKPTDKLYNSCKSNYNTMMTTQPQVLCRMFMIN